MSHEHKNTTYCATEPIQTILNDRPKYGIAKKRQREKTHAFDQERENKKIKIKIAVAVKPETRRVMKCSSNKKFI